ncbi:MAG TPA: hypothetical protein VKY89_08525 [Thermoanaerobaculia bacterium]|jgi:hypothetical protein|nr:hypothetical protein [Thermoanaerobaculia bacterium]
MPEGRSWKAEGIVHDLLDSVLPEGLDWEHLVRSYPAPALAVAALGGFLVGRAYGPEIIEAVSSFAAAEVAKNVGCLLGQELET